MWDDVSFILTENDTITIMEGLPSRPEEQMEPPVRRRDALKTTLIFVNGLAALICGLNFAVTARALGSAPVQPAAAAVATPVLRRLTRVEYANSLRDLFGVEFPFAADLPADGQAAGFDDIGDALSLSPVLVDSYLKVARRVSDLILGIGGAGVVTQQFPAMGTQSEWQERMPIGTRGGVLIKYFFPRQGEYDLRAFLDNQMVFGKARLASPLTPLEGVRFFHMRTAISAGLHTFIVTFPDTYAAWEGSVPNFSGPGGAGEGGPIDIRASAVMHTIQFWLDGKVIRTFDIHGPGISEAAFEAQPGPPTLARAEITGPFNPSAAVDTQARRRLFTCVPHRASQENACAAKILEPIARLAYRRDVNSADMAPVLAAFSRKRSTANFDEAVGMGLRTILMSPDFLFRVERDPPDAKPGTVYPLSGFELATRLSYFIWSSIPDDHLLQRARHDRLRDHETLEHELRRMFADSRSDALVDNFALQWLGLRDLADVHPDTRVYPEYDNGLARDFEEETRLFLRSVMRENRSVLDVISSDYAFLNQRLAQLYGIPAVEGPAFREVQLSSDEERGGVLSQGSVLMVTSHAAQTSPILRGKWVLTNLLNSPPPVPPPGVPPLNTNPAADGHRLTTREQIERHRISPVCVSCHAKMDPYGMALENYDVLGRWRTEENGSPIDSSAALPHGDPFVGPAGLKKLLLARADNFAAATVARLMTYALGRQLDKSDEPAVREITAAAKPGGYRFEDLVTGVVTSAPFEERQTKESP